MFTLKQTLSISLLGASLGWLQCQAEFIHPGLMYTTEIIETFRHNALSGNPTTVSAAYADLLSDSRAMANYTMRGPATVIGNKGDTNATVTANAEAWEADVLAVYLNALNYAIGQDEANADTVASIVDAWSSTLEYVMPDSNFVSGLIGSALVNGIELVVGVHGGRWPTGEANLVRAMEMVTNLLLGVKNGVADPADGQPVAGGNQAFLGHMAGLAFAVFTGNQTGFEEEMDIIMLDFDDRECVGYHGSGMQALLHPVTGQSAEAGRDQGHAADEVGWVEQAARMAANQGRTEVFDFPSQDGAETPLLLLAMEYYFKYNLGNDDVPFDTEWHPCCCGTGLDYQVISDTSRGVVKPIGEAAYNYYVGAKNLSMPYTEEWLSVNRPLNLPDENLLDFYPFTTLTWGFSEL